jgi:hypothetical protein
MLSGLLLFAVPYGIGWYLSRLLNKNLSSGAVWGYSVGFAFVCLVFALFLVNMNTNLAGIAGGGGFTGMYWGLKKTKDEQPKT